jgi:hypothetical protein
VFPLATTKPYSREQIMALEDALKDLPNQLEADSLTKHYFAPGIYLRSLFIPAGSVITGKIHRHEVMNILVFGTIQATTDRGIETLEGPYVFNSKPGTKKAVHALTNCLWMNVHPTELTDLEEIEREFIVPSFEALEQEDTLCLGSQ